MYLVYLMVITWWHIV